MRNKGRKNEARHKHKIQKTQKQNEEKRRTGESTWTTQANQGEAKNQNPNFDFVCCKPF